MKSLIVSSVDKVPGAANKTITGGRLNVAAAMSALDAMLTARGVPKLAPASPPPPSPPPPSPALPLPVLPVQPNGSAVIATSPSTVCGTTPLAGLNSATQSSTSGAANANLAIDGDCRMRRVWQGSCSQTSEWWLAGRLAGYRSLALRTDRGHLGQPHSGQPKGMDAAE